MATCIAVIDDETVILDLLREVLREEGYAVHTFSAGTAAFSRVRALAVMAEMSIRTRGRGSPCAPGVQCGGLP